MIEENLDMFGYDNVTMKDIEQLMPDDEMKKRWPEIMLTVYELIREECVKFNIDEQIAMIMLAKLCKKTGGLQFYFPKGEILEHQLKLMYIWRDFNGNNVFELARKYDTSTQNIYTAIRTMRSVEVKKRQFQLF